MCLCACDSVNWQVKSVLMLWCRSLVAYVTNRSTVLLLLGLSEQASLPTLVALLELCSPVDSVVLKQQGAHKE